MSNTEYTMTELLQMVREKALSYNVERVTSASDVYHALAEYVGEDREHWSQVVQMYR